MAKSCGQKRVPLREIVLHHENATTTVAETIYTGLRKLHVPSQVAVASTDKKFMITSNPERSSKNSGFELILNSSRGKQFLGSRMALSGTSFSRSYTLDHQQDHTLLHIAFEITPALVPLLAGLYRGMYLRPDWLSIGGFGRSAASAGVGSAVQSASAGVRSAASAGVGSAVQSASAGVGSAVQSASAGVASACKGKSEGIILC